MSEDLAQLTDVLQILLETTAQDTSRPFEIRNSRYFVDVDYLLSNPPIVISEARKLRQPYLQSRSKFIWTDLLDYYFRVAA